MTSLVQSAAWAAHTQQHTPGFGHFIIMWTGSQVMSDSERLCVCMHTLLLTFIYHGKVDRAACSFAEK